MKARLNPILVALLAALACGVNSQAQLVPSLTPIDVGTPPLPGSTIVNGPGSFAVAGSGEYKNSGSDNFHFAYTNVTGDFDYRARVESLDVPSQWSKAGLMARETTPEGAPGEVGSRFIAMTAYPPPPNGGNTYILIRREQADMATADDIFGSAPTYPNSWVRLRRTGDTFIGYTGTNGVNWDVQGVRDSASWPDGALKPDLLLGLAVASAINSATTTAQFRDFGPVPATNAVAISVPLKSLTINKGKPATFTAVVTGYDPYHVQWFTNNILVPAASGVSYSGLLSYSTPPLTLGDDNTTVSIVVSNAVGMVTNNAVLHVVDDNTPPAVTAATSELSGIDVLFNEEVASGTALDMSRYKLQNADVEIFGIALSSNQRIVSLTTSGPVTTTNATLTITGMEDLVGNSQTQTVPLWLLLSPSNIVASGYPVDRESAFASVTEGTVDSGWQTNGDKDHRPQFAGLLYTNAQTFAVVKMDLGEQNEFGGSFTETPKLYLLKNNIDTDVAGPEADPANWTEVPAPLVSPNLFDGNVDPNPSPASPIVFDLTSLSPSARVGFGWAIGGVRGDNSGFIRLSELRAFGQDGGTVEVSPSLSIARNAASGIVISWPTAAGDFALNSATDLASPVWSAVTDPKVIVGSNYNVTIGFSGETRFFRLEK